ncbi:cytochrome bc1 complex diheme cytochrome c subunit [Virgisporangium aliadipatigenens]|uniref:cytochrome bc1 complex diheme cytochrome c subunit n=1 Tax=Virgisporangium aliadipatigenens TaxID=741659 RepID=UPI00194471BE|nr:cytochrome c [Virgisporangium aliadipatigenens]
MSWKLGRRRRAVRPDDAVPAFTPPGRWRRRLEATVRLIAALTIVGGLYAALAPGVSQAEDTPPLSADAVQGKQLYETTCISCHGPNAQGVENRGPSLIGAGSAAVEFQVGTGRMPMARQEAQAQKKPPHYSWEQAAQIGAYIQELGGGPTLPKGQKLRATDEKAISRGGELYRINCSACHGFGLGGGALSSGKYAPSLNDASDREIYAAMLTGPQNMPVFGDAQLTPEEKLAVIGYIQSLKANKDPGGFGMKRFGPVSEGLMIFLVGMVALVFATLWIAGKS